MLILKIKHAEAALVDGRLEEACQLARDSELRRHARGQRLVTQLVSAFIARGKEHLAAGRPDHALADCEKAGKLDPSNTETESLRQLALKAITDHQRDCQRNNRIAQDAAKRIDHGELSVGQQMLDQLTTDDGEQSQLFANAKRRRSAGEVAVRRIRDAIKNNDPEPAIDALSQLKQNHQSHQDVFDLTNLVTALVITHAQAAFDQGRVDLADSLINRLSYLASNRSQLTELSNSIAQCKRAWQLISDNDMDQAAQILQRLTLICPKAKWLGVVISQSRKTLDNLAELQACPLGLLDTEISPAVHSFASSERVTGNDSQLPSRFIIQVDGLAAFLVIRSAVVTLGPISSPQLPDLGLIADPSLPITTIERIDGDYFINVPRPGRVNDHHSSNHLLRNDDRIALSQRCRMKFNLPNPATSTAVLDLTSARLPRPDIRKVILLDEQMVIGSESSAHIRVSSMVEPMVLHTRNDGLLCNIKQQITVDNLVHDPGRALPIGRQIVVGRLSFVVTRI